MANVYFMVMDTTKDREDPAQMCFFQMPYNNDLAGAVRLIAEQNGTEISEMRLFVYPTKKEWADLRAAFVKRADWSRARL